MLSKTLKLGRVDIFMLTGTIWSWRSWNLCVPQTTLPNWKRNYRKWIRLIFVHQREPIPNESFTKRQIWQFLQRYSKMHPWVVKILYYLSRSWEVKTWTALVTKRTPKNHTKTFLAFSEHLFSTCMEMGDLKKKHPHLSSFSWTIVGKEIHQSSRVFTWLIFESGEDVEHQYICLRHSLCGWRADWGTSTRYSKVWKERQIFTLQQWHLLHQRHELLFQIFSLQHMWHNLFKDWKGGATLDYM